MPPALLVFVGGVLAVLSKPRPLSLELSQFCSGAAAATAVAAAAALRTVAGSFLPAGILPCVERRIVDCNCDWLVYSKLRRAATVIAEICIVEVIGAQLSPELGPHAIYNTTPGLPLILVLFYLEYIRFVQYLHNKIIDHKPNYHTNYYECLITS